MTADGRQPHILVVNDTQEILDLMADLLEEEGYRVTTSLALLDIDKVKALAPDVIVQDLLFEGMQETGWKFLTLVRLDPELARIPLILCTAAVRTVNDPAMAEQLDRLGIRVVLKPFLIDDLLTALSETRTAQALIDQATTIQQQGDQPMSETRTNDVAAAVAHIEQAMESRALNRSPREGSPPTASPPFLRTSSTGLRPGRRRRPVIGGPSPGPRMRCRSVDDAPWCHRLLNGHDPASILRAPLR